MSDLGDAATAALLLSGGFFFLAGTVGLLRFPDTLTRLHALTKADNVGLGLIVAGLAIQAGSPFAAAKLVVIWILALVASATAAYLIGGRAARLPGGEAGREDIDDA
jgi:multicomponent Na+:H+ antiporter subunit G